MQLPLLETTRLRLRPLTLADVDALWTIFGDEEVMRYWSSAPLTDRGAAEALLLRILEGYASGTFLQLGVERRDSHTLVGTCTMFAHHSVSRRAEIGYALGRAHWGRGFMQEALACFLEYLFEELQLNRLEADIDPDNLASARILERAGFIREGFCPQRWIVSGRFSDSVLFGLLRDHWRNKRER